MLEMDYVNKTAKQQQIHPKQKIPVNPTQIISKSRLRLYDHDQDINHTCQPCARR